MPAKGSGGGPCSVPTCAQPLEARGWCLAHYRRASRRNWADPTLDGRDGSPGPRVERPNYNSAHDRVRALHGSSTLWLCVSCAAPAQDWAYLHTDERELRTGRGYAYSADPNHYVPMCKSCHKTFDLRRIAA